MIEEQMKIEQEKQKMKKKEDKRNREEQKKILGKGNARPKLSFSLMQNNLSWDEMRLCGPTQSMTMKKWEAIIPFSLGGPGKEGYILSLGG